MEGTDLKLANKVLDKAFKKIVELGKYYTSDEGINELPNSYESALKVARIHTVVQTKELIDSIQELEEIANVGVLETMWDENLKDEFETRHEIHSNIIDLNNEIATVFADLVEDILGEEEMQNISLKVQLGDIV